MLASACRAGADPLGDRTFYDVADERVPDDRAEKFWKVFGERLPRRRHDFS